MGKRNGESLLPGWFGQATKIVAALVVVFGAVGAVVLYFLFPATVRALESIAAPKTEDFALRLWAWVFSAGWGLSICLFLMIIYLVCWCAHVWRKTQASVERKVEIGVASRRVESILSIVKATAWGVIELLNEDPVKYNGHEAHRKYVVEQLKTGVGRIARAYNVTRQDFAVLVGTRQGMLLKGQIGRLLDSVDTDLFAEANKFCGTTTDWEIQVEKIQTNAKTLIAQANHYLDACRELDPSRPAGRRQDPPRTRTDDPCQDESAKDERRTA